MLRVVVASMTGSLGSETTGSGDMVAAGAGVVATAAGDAGCGVGTLVPGCCCALATDATLEMSRPNTEARFFVHIGVVFLRAREASARRRFREGRCKSPTTAVLTAPRGSARGPK